MMNELKTNTSVTFLNFSVRIDFRTPNLKTPKKKNQSKNFTEMGTHAIAETLQINKTLQTLYLNVKFAIQQKKENTEPNIPQCNRLGINGIEKLSEGILVNQTLTELHLQVKIQKKKQKKLFIQ